MRSKGEPFAPRTMIEAGRAGIGMVVQEQGSIPGLTIVSTIFLGVENQFRRFGFVSRSEEPLGLTTQLGLSSLNPPMVIDYLDPHGRKLIEIARDLVSDPEVLIIDETATALSHEGREITYRLMRSMAGLFISHDLEKLMETCDSLNVHRDEQYPCCSLVRVAKWTLGWCE